MKPINIPGKKKLKNESLDVSGLLLISFDMVVFPFHVIIFWIGNLFRNHLVLIGEALKRHRLAGG